MAQLAQADESEAPHAIDHLSEHVVGVVPTLSFAEDSSSNSDLALILIVVGVLFLAGAIWGAIKGLIKLAVILGILAAVAWFFYFNR